MNSEDKILEKLDTLIKLSATQVASGKNLKEQVRLLSSVGMSPGEIARLLNKTANAIRVTLHRIGKEEERERGKTR